MTLTKFKREKRKCLLCLIFSVILIISSFILAIYTYNHNNKVKADTMENNALYDNIYVLNGTIMCVNKSTNKVYVVSDDGNVFIFKGIEDWLVNDRCILLMDNKGTNNIKDDVIIQTIYQEKYFFLKIVVDFFKKV